MPGIFEILDKAPRASTPNEPGILDSLDKGLRAGFYGGKSQLNTLAGTAMDAVSPGLGGDRHAASQAAMRESQEAGSHLTPLEGVDGVGSGLRYVAGMVGSSTPQIAAGLGASLMTGGGALPMLAAGTMAQLPFEAGESLQRMRADPVASRLSPGGQLGVALPSGLAAAGVQSIVPFGTAAKLAGKFTAPSMKRIGANALADIPAEGFAEGAGEGIRQVGLNVANPDAGYDVGAIGRNALEGAIMGGALGTVGAAGQTAHLLSKEISALPGRAIEAGKALVPDNAKKRAGEAVDNAQERIEDGVDAASAWLKDAAGKVDVPASLREFGQKAMKSTAALRKRMASGQETADPAELEAATSYEAKAAVFERADQSATDQAMEWGKELLKGKLSPEKATQVKAWMDTARDKTSRAGLAAMHEAKGFAQDIHRAVQRFANRNVKGEVVGEATEVPERPALGGIKKSEVSTEAGQAIYRAVTGVLGNDHPAVNDPAVRADFGRSLRKYIDDVANGKAFSSFDKLDQLQDLYDITGENTTSLLAAVHASVSNAGKEDKKIFRTLNQMDALFKGRQSVLETLQKNLLPAFQRTSVMSELKTEAEMLEKWARDKYEPGIQRTLDDAEVQFRDTQVRRGLQARYGDKADLVMNAVEKNMKTEQNMIDGEAKRELDSDDAGIEKYEAGEVIGRDPTNESGREFVATDETNTTRLIPQNKQLYMDPAIDDDPSPYGSAAQQRLATAKKNNPDAAVQFRKASELDDTDPKVRAMIRAKKNDLIDAALTEDGMTQEKAEAYAEEYIDQFGLVTIERSKRETGLSGSEVQKLKINAKYKDSPSAIDAGEGLILDAAKITAKMAGKLKGDYVLRDDTGKRFRAARMFMEGVAAAQAQLGRSFEIPDSVEITYRVDGQPGMTFGEARKLSKDGESSPATQMSKRPKTDLFGPVPTSEGLPISAKIKDKIRELNGRKQAIETEVALRAQDLIDEMKSMGIWLTKKNVGDAWQQAREPRAAELEKINSQIFALELEHSTEDGAGRQRVDKTGFEGEIERGFDTSRLTSSRRTKDNLQTGEIGEGVPGKTQGYTQPSAKAQRINEINGELTELTERMDSGSATGADRVAATALRREREILQSVGDQQLGTGRKKIDPFGPTLDATRGEGEFKASAKGDIKPVGKYNPETEIKTNADGSARDDTVMGRRKPATPAKGATTMRYQAPGRKLNEEREKIDPTPITKGTTLGTSAVQAAKEMAKGSAAAKSLSRKLFALIDHEGMSARDEAVLDSIGEIPKFSDRVTPINKLFEKYKPKPAENAPPNDLTPDEYTLKEPPYARMNAPDLMKVDAAKLTGDSLKAWTKAVGKVANTYPLWDHYDPKPYHQALQRLDGVPPSPKALAAKKAALLKAASSSDPALLDELSTTTDAKALQRVVAHLSTELFTQFDMSKAGKNASVFGKAAYFTTNDSTIAKYRWVLGTGKPLNEYRTKLRLADGEILDATKTIGEQHPDILKKLGKFTTDAFLKEHASDRADQLWVTLRQRMGADASTAFSAVGIKAVHHAESIPGAGVQGGSWAVYDPAVIGDMQRVNVETTIDEANARLRELVQNPDVAYNLQTKKYSMQSDVIHASLGRLGFGAAHDSPTKHAGVFDWRTHALKGEGAMMKGAGTYLSTSDAVHGYYKKLFTNAVIEKRNQALFADSDENYTRPDKGISAGKAPTYHLSVDIEPEQLMDWDKPLSQQSETVKAAAQAAAQKALPTWTDAGKGSFTARNDRGERIYIIADKGKLELTTQAETGWVSHGFFDSVEAAKSAAAEQKLTRDVLSMSGEDFYRELSASFDLDREVGDPQASDYLQPLGVLGHRMKASAKDGDVNPNYVIYDDSKIHVNYVHFDKSKVTPGAQGPINRKEVADYVERVLGPNVGLAWSNILHAGEFERTGLGDIIRLSIHSLNPLSTAYHESLHGFFARLNDAGHKDIRAVLETAANSAPLMNQLKKLLANEPAALAQLSDPEEAAAYMYQFWAQGKLTVGPQVNTLFQRIAKFLREITGLLTNDERALQIMEYFNSGEYQKNSGNPNAVHAALMEGGMKGMLDKVDKMTKPLQDLAETIASAGGTRLRDSGIPALRELADAMKLKTTSEGTDPGFLPASRQERSRVMNELGKDLKPYSDEDMREALEAMQNGTKATGVKARIVMKIVDRRLGEMLNYMQTAGVQITRLGLTQGVPYFPRSWDASFISAHQKEFLAMLEKYVLSGELKGDPKKILEKLMVTDGNEFNIETNMPGMQNSKERILAFIKHADAAPFMRKDLYQILNSYVTQATRRAEWARRFQGTDDKGKYHENQHITDLFDDAKAQGATPKQIADAQSFIRAVDGTLGDTINPSLRRLQGNIIVYENIRLLPLAIFSSIVDPMGILVRGGTVSDSFKAFKRGMKEVVKNFQKDPQGDAMTQLAEAIGTVDNAALVHAMGASYSQGMVGDTGRKWNDTFFRLNLMEQFNTSMRVSATEAALLFLARHASKPTTHSARYFNELGLTAADIKVGVNGRPAVLEADGLTAAESAKMKAAINRWVDGAVLRPDAVDKPVWMSDPHYALIAHLKQFVFSFHETILKRVVHEAKNGNYTPAMALASYVPIMIASDSIKGMIQGGGDEPQWKKNWGVSDYVWSGMERAGVFGTGQFALDMLQDVQRGGTGVGALSGPAIEQMADAVQVIGGREQFGSFALKSLPANALYAGAVGGESTDPKFVD